MPTIHDEEIVTPYRVSHLRMDLDDQVLLQPPYSLIRAAHEIARGAIENKTPAEGESQSQIHQVRLLQNVGWELDTYQSNIGNKSERNESASGTMLPSLGTLQVAEKHIELALFAKPTDLNGSDSSWYHDNLNTTGDIFIQKRIGDEDSFEQRLSSDQTAFPSAVGTSGNNVAMDRVARSVGNHDGSPVDFAFIKPTTTNKATDIDAQFLFSGPAGSGNRYKGTGRYQLEFQGDGKCQLWESVRFDGAPTVDKWLPVHSFQYAPAYTVGGQAVRIRIRPVMAGQVNYAPFGAIVFEVKVDSKAVYESGPGILGAKTTNKPGRTAQSTFVVSRSRARTQDSPPTPIAAPVRVDVRRDQRIPFQVSKSLYRPTGYLIDDHFALDFYPVYNLTLKVYAIGVTPASTALTPRLFRSDDDAEISAVATTGNRTDFTIPERVRHFYIRWDFEGPETGDATPILEGYQVVLDGYIGTVSPGEFETEGSGAIPNQLMSVSITGQEADPSHESMQVELDDVGDTLTRLHSRGALLAQLEQEYDPEDPELRCILFRGHMVDNEDLAKGHGVATGQFPDRNWKSYDLTFMGVWKRLSESLSSIRFDWHGPDPTAAVGPDGVQPPWKATDAIRTMFYWAGFPPGMVNIPDIDIRLYPSTTNDLFIEPLSNLCDYIVRIAHDYLAMWITFDPNQGTYGKWSLIGTPTAPYDIKYQLVDSGPSSKLAHSLLSYDDDPPTAFIAKIDGQSSLRTQKKILEANRLVVTGTGLLAGAPPDLELLTQVFYNFRSYNPFNLDESHPWYPDPEHPDYVGYDKPLYVVDPTLQTPEAVNLVGRRIFDVACYSTRLGKLLAPLVFLDHEDEVDRKRPPRFYDPLTLTRFGVDSTWLTRNVNPSYKKDNLTMAAYEIESIREPFLVPIPIDDDV